MRSTDDAWHTCAAVEVRMQLPVATLADIPMVDQTQTVLWATSMVHSNQICPIQLAKTIPTIVNRESYMHVTVKLFINNVKPIVSIEHKLWLFTPDKTLQMTNITPTHITVSWPCHYQLRNGEICWSKLVVLACRCQWQLAHSD